MALPLAASAALLLLLLALAPPAARAASFLVNTSAVVQPLVSKRIMGCRE